MYSSIDSLLQFLRFIRKGSDWDKLGISIRREDCAPIGKEKFRIKLQIVPTWNNRFSDIHLAITQIVNEEVFITNKPIDMIRAFKWILKVHKACIKVNQMKVFL